MRSPDEATFEGLTIGRRDNPAGLAKEIAFRLSAPGPIELPPKLLYDDAGCELFDRICELPEYYPTRTERALLLESARDIARRTRADELVELGSGLARKTPVLLDALGAGKRPVRYLPFDVSESVVQASGERLRHRYPLLRLHGIVGDFALDLRSIPAGRNRIIAFLGGTLGNFDTAPAQAFLNELALLLNPGDFLLIAADLVKDHGQLHAAYNDRDGLTAQFNLNVLHRLRRELGFEINPDDFVHDAFFDPALARIEMHLRAMRRTHIGSARFGVARTLEAGESIQTEISRKFTTAQLDQMHAAAGLTIEQRYVARTPYQLTLSRRVDSTTTSI